MISVCFQGKPFNITVIQVNAKTSNFEEAEVEWLYENLQDLLENIQKRWSFHYRKLECKSRKSRDTLTRVTGKFVLGLTGQRLTEFAKRTHWS